MGTASEVRQDMMTRLALIGTVAIAIAGCATASEQNTGAATDNAPAASQTASKSKAKMTLVPDPDGKVEKCIQINSIRQSDVRDDKTIDFTMNNGKVYRNNLSNSCPSLGFEKAFSYKTSLSVLCNTDIITVLHQGGGPRMGASCGLGDFQPMKKAEKTEMGSAE